MDVIDADWIRRHLTHRHGELKALADAVGIGADKITKILNGTRRVQAHEAPRIAAFFQKDRPGFAEPAQTYRAAVTPINPTARMQTLAGALCPDIPRPEFYRVSRPAPAAGLLQGDLLIVQLGMSAVPGGLVVATIADTDTDQQVSVIRRYWPPLLVPVCVDDQAPALPADGEQSIAILATVKAMARGGITA